MISTTPSHHGQVMIKSLILASSFRLHNFVPENLALRFEDVAIDLCIFIVADRQFVALVSGLLNIDPPDTEARFGITDENHRSIGKSDAHIAVKTVDLVFFVSAPFDFHKIVGAAVYLNHSTLPPFRRLDTRPNAARASYCKQGTYQQMQIFYSLSSYLVSIFWLSPAAAPGEGRVRRGITPFRIHRNDMGTLYKPHNYPHDVIQVL